MVGYRLIWISILLILLGESVQAQNRYAIHYKYKPQTDFSLNTPQNFLTDASLLRRSRQQINLDSLDLPVSIKYIDAVKPLVNNFLYHSKWLNASVAIADAEVIVALEALDFVEKVVLVAPGFLPQGRIQPTQSHKKFEAITSEESLNSRLNNSSEFAFQNGLLGIPFMHEEGYKGQGMTIAVFDAGFPGVNTIPALNHLITNNRIIGTKDFVEPWSASVFRKNQHGSNVLSLIAANDADVLVAGAPEANYILCITEDVPTEYRIEEYNWVKAAEYADSLGVDIINSSLGYWDFDDSTMDYTFSDLNGETSVITKGATVAGERGILVVTSAGNYGFRGPSSITMPADAKGILAVGSVVQDLSRSSFSSQGPTADGRIKPDLTTLGSQVWLLRSNGTAGRSNGTSFSSPQIAALAAGIWQAKPELTKDELIGVMLQSATQAENPDNQFGYGIPDFRKAYLGEVLNINPERIQRKLFPNPLMGNIFFLDFDQELNVQIQLLDVQGRLVHYGDFSRKESFEPFSIAVPQLKSGLYIVRALAGGKVYSTKLIKK
ncbi:MAG: S8 family serine peptidase [Mongoliitalea sp.]